MANSAKGILNIPVYKPYVISKKIRAIYYIKMRITYRKLFRFYTDLKGLYDPLLLGGNLYAAIVLDDWSRKSWILFLLFKDSFFESFVPLLKVIEAKSGKKLSKLRIDGGGEFVNEAFDKFYKGRRIIFEPISPYTPEQNLPVERTWRTLSENKDSILNECGLPRNFWVETMVVANYLRNRFLAAGRNKISEELWIFITLNVSHLRVFGCIIYSYIPKENR